MAPIGKVELSVWLRDNYPINKSSKTKHKTICGFGTNDADYVVNPSIGGVRTPCLAYTTWRGAVQRSVDLEYKRKHPAYQDVNICEEWRSFMTFRSWWLLHYREGFEIDKDILSSDVKIYSPSTCVFVPKWLNSFTKTHSSALKGVLFEAGRQKFKATIKHENRTINLGRYDSAEEASLAVKEAKISIIKPRKNQIDAINPALFDAVMLKILEGP